MYTVLEIAGKEYKLRLRTMDVIQLEKRIGHNIMDMVMDLQKDKLPQLNEMLAIIHAAMGQFNHGMKERDVYNLYDEFIADGNNMFDLVPIVIELMQSSGIIPREEEVEAEQE